MLGASPSVASFAGRRILAIRAGALGDTIVALPSVAALRRLVGPEGKLDFVGTEPAVRLALSGRLATRVHSIDRVPFRALFENSADDRALNDFLRPFALVVAWANLPLLEDRLSKLGIPLVQTSPQPPPGVHASDHLYRALTGLGIEGTAPAPEIEVESGSLAAALDLLERHELSPSGFVALHPSSGSPRKNWPRERFAELGLLLRKEGWPFVWIEGEADADIVSYLAAGGKAPVLRGLPLPVLAALLSLTRGLVGNDSGVSHLAAAVKARSLVLYGPTDPTVWAPRGPFVQVASCGASAERVWGEARSFFRDP